MILGFHALYNFLGSLFSVALENWWNNIEAILDFSVSKIWNFFQIIFWQITQV
jgi:hypothetical protein